MDGELLGGLPTYLPGRWQGSVGLMHWKPEGAQPLLRVKRLRFSELTFNVHVVSSALSTEEIQAAVAQMPQLAAISPRLFELNEEGLSRAPLDDTLVLMLSYRFGWEIVPTARITNHDLAGLEEMLSAVETEPFTGLRVELDQLSASARPQVRKMLARFARERAWKRGRLIISSPGVLQTARRSRP